MIKTSKQVKLIFHLIATNTHSVKSVQIQTRKDPYLHTFHAVTKIIIIIIIIIITISDYLAIFNLKLEFFRSNSRQRCKVAVPGAV